MNLETVSQMRGLTDLKVRRYQYETLSLEEYVWKRWWPIWWYTWRKWV